jgi:hypothetical protein
VQAGPVYRPLPRSDCAGHVGPAAQGRLDLAVPVRALADANLVSTIKDENRVHEGSLTGTTRGVDGHPALRAGVKGHEGNVGPA